MTYTSRERHSIQGAPKSKKTFKKQLLALSIGAGSALIGSSVSAMELVSNNDWNVRWDNTVKYNLMQRVEGQDSDVTRQNSLVDDADLNFEKNDIVSNRLDILTEFDAMWRDTFGVRISAAGWYDHAYSNDGDYSGNRDLVPGQNSNTWGTLSAGFGEYSDDAEKYHYNGGELLDAFVFYGFDTDSISGSVKAGRHALFWGNSLGISGAIAGIGGAMAPLDLSKGLSVPGSEAQELFMPTNKISTVIQLTNNLTLNAYWSLEYQENRLPEAGTYFSLGEMSTDNGEFFVSAAGVVGNPAAPRAGFVKLDHEEPKDEKEWGLNLQYYSEELGMDIGLVYLNYNDKSTGLTIGRAIVPPSEIPAAIYPTLLANGLEGVTVLNSTAVSVGDYKWVNKSDIELFGITLNKEIGGWSTGLDFVFRKDAALRSDTATAMALYNPAAYASASTPAQAPLVGGLTAALTPSLGAAAGPTAEALVATINGGPLAEAAFNNVNADNFPGAIGDVASVTLNGLKIFGESPLWDSASVAGEVVASWITDVSENEALLLGNLSENRVFTSVNVIFKPTYYQVFPSTDLSVPMSVSMGIDGNSPLGQGGDEDIGSASVGLEFTYQETLKVGFKYNSYFGPAEGGPSGVLKDRDNISLTVKRTF